MPILGSIFELFRQGTISPNSEVEIIYKHPANITVKDLFRAHFDSKFPNQEKVMRAAVDIPELADAWKTKVADRLHMIDLYRQRPKKIKLALN